MKCPFNALDSYAGPILEVAHFGLWARDERVNSNVWPNQVRVDPEDPIFVQALGGRLIYRRIGM
jgi:hypothetical protein